MDVRVGLWGKLSTKKLLLLNCGVGEDLRVPRTAGKSNQSILKEINPGCSLERMILKLKLQYFGHFMRRVDSSSVVPFSSCPQSFPTSGSFPVSQFLTSGGQSIGASASASVLPMNIQNWFPLGLTGLISLQSKELSRVFSNTTVQKHQFFGPQLSLWSNFHIHTWLLEKPQLWLDGTLPAVIGISVIH